MDDSNAKIATMAKQMATVSLLTHLDESFGSTNSAISDEDYDSAFDDESECSSSCSSLLGDEDDILRIISKSSESPIAKNPTELSSPCKVRRSNSLPSFNEIEMSSTQVSVMLNQLRNSNHGVKQQDCRTSKIKKLEHIQGVAMDAVTSTRCIEDPTIVFNDILTESGFDPRVISHNELGDYFLNVTESRLTSYSMNIINAVRTGDLDFLRMSHFEQKHDLTCCNRFGESIIHIACRHSMVDVVRFLIEEANVSLRVVDDFGRNPCHDTAWQSAPNMELIQLLASHEPDLLLISDKRGFTPLQYLRKERWPEWVEFLRKNRADVLPKKLLQPQRSYTAGSA